MASFAPCHLPECFSLHKVKPHTGIPGNERANQNSAKGVYQRSPIGRFSTFPPSSLFPLPSITSSFGPTAEATTLRLVDAFSSQLESNFLTSSLHSRKPYLSSHILHLVHELQSVDPESQKSPRHKIKRFPKKDKSSGLFLNLRPTNILFLLRINRKPLSGLDLSIHLKFNPSISPMVNQLLALF